MQLDNESKADVQPAHKGPNNNGTPHAPVVRHRQRLENYHDLQYFGYVELGGRKVRAIFDTGSFDVLVAAVRCDGCTGPPYRSNESSSYRASDPQKVVEIHFGSGDIEAVAGSEAVNVGPLRSRGQTFFEVRKDPDGIFGETASFGAIVGLGPATANQTRLGYIEERSNETRAAAGNGGRNGTENGTDNATTRSPTLISTGTLLRNMNVSEFSVCLEREQGAPGWLTWNGDLTPEQKMNATKLEVVGRMHWAVNMWDMLPDIPFSGGRLEAAQTLLCGKGCAALLDSGTSLISAPDYSLNGLSYLLPELHENCSNFEELPDLAFTLSGRKLRLPPESYAMRLRGSPEEKKHASFILHFKPKPAALARPEDVCFYAFSPINSHTDYGPLWILGMPFFRQFHVTFGLGENPENRSIWLTEASEDCKPVPLEAETAMNATDGNKTKENVVFDGVGVHPKIVVAQRERHAVRVDGRAQRRREPRVVEARDLRAPRVPDLLPL